ncbi:MAG TPA: hypothetical protein PK390_00840 [Fervidobacterium nodosum]|nr:hypothetical protein [Fervidobacterium nodosum]
METVSTYGHEKTHVLLEEIKIGNQLIRELKNYFENIYVLDGNHERRLGRYIERKAEEIAFLTPYSANYYVCRNIRFLDDCIEDYGPLDGIKYVKTRFLLIGDVLFTHPDTFLRAPASLLKRVIETAISEDI